MTNVEKKGNCPYHALEFASKVATLKKRFTRELFEPIEFGTVRPAPPPQYVSLWGETRPLVGGMLGIGYMNLKTPP